MKRELLRLLCCPVCKGSLLLEVESEEANQIIKGTLICIACTLCYSIDDGIPNLLPPDMR
jgi:uncharacterized protein YbaR (Trm112 family)